MRAPSKSLLKFLYTKFFTTLIHHKHNLKTIALIIYDLNIDYVT
jgi:hypothetical protein